MWSALRRRPALALAAVVASAFVVYTALAVAVDVPRVHPDEVRYLIGASSLVEGEGLTLRGGEYGFGPLYALVVAAILLLTSGPDAGYDLFKAANALFFALTAVPMYLLARRLVPPWWAVLAAALSIAIPSSISVATVMTESLAFLAAAWALLGIAIALERPTVGNQLAMLAAIAAAFLTRPQLGVLYVTWVVALVLVWLLLPGSRPQTRRDLLAFWPSVLPLALAGAVLGRRLLSGSSPSESLGAYWELWRGYELGAVAKWVVYHLADMEIYLAVIPLAVAPIVLASLLRRARGGDERSAVWASLFLSANALGLLVVAAFTSTPYGYDRLHDRYAFYLFPLWLILFVRWLSDGLPRPLVPTSVGVVLALVLPAVLPFRQLANEAGIDTVPGALWVRLEAEVAGPGLLSGRVLLAVFVVGLLAAALLVPRRYALAVSVVVLAVLLVEAVPAWDRMIGAPEDAVFAGGLERAWVDERLPDEARVTKLYLESDWCPASALSRHALFLTEFFNETVDRAAYLDDSIPDGIPLERVNVGAGGALELSPGDPFEADYVYTQPGIELAGERVATGTAAGLVLWRTGGPVRVVGARTTTDVRTTDCS